MSEGSWRSLAEVLAALEAGLGLPAAVAAEFHPTGGNVIPLNGRLPAAPPEQRRRENVAGDNVAVRRARAFA